MIVAVRMFKNGFSVEPGASIDSTVIEADEKVTMRHALVAALAEVKLQFLERIKEIEDREGRNA